MVLDIWTNGTFAIRNERYKLAHFYNSSRYAKWYETDDSGVLDVNWNQNNVNTLLPKLVRNMEPRLQRLCIRYSTYKPILLSNTICTMWVRWSWKQSKQSCTRIWQRCMREQRMIIPKVILNS